MDKLQNGMITRVSCKDLTIEQFFIQYFEPELPLIITGVNDEFDFSDWSPRAASNLIKDHNLEKNKLWYQLDGSIGEISRKTPPLVKEALSSEISHTKNRFIRLWSNVKGDRTLLHADANGLFVFNLQVLGRKRWKIYSPDTKFKMYSFTNIPILKYNKYIPSGLQNEEISFFLEEGDMLFLPAYWYHGVETISDYSVNLNWIGTRKTPLLNNAIARENRLFKIMIPLSKLDYFSRLVDLTCGSMEEHYIDNFGGSGGRAFLKQRIKGTSLLSAILVFLYEALMLPYFFFKVKAIKEYSKST